MHAQKNRQWILKSRPTPGPLSDSYFEFKLDSPVFSILTHKKSSGETVILAAQNKTNNR